jgi:hypothetical protein
MKKIFLTFILFLSATSFSTENLQLLSNFEKLNSKNIKENLKSVINDIDQFSEIKKLGTSDLKLTVSVLKTLVLLDAQDPSRTAHQMLAVSYSENKKIYKSAFKKLTAAEKNELKDLFEMLENLHSQGNG